MINEERVKQLYKIALYEQSNGREQQQFGQYYQADYIGKEMIKSIFTGTIAFGCMCILWVLGTWEEFLDSINNLQVVGTAVRVVIVYVIFMILYLAATYVIYLLRYREGRKKMKDYMGDLKKARQMYEREEKLKL